MASSATMNEFRGHSHPAGISSTCSSIVVFDKSSQRKSLLQAILSDRAPDVVFREHHSGALPQKPTMVLVALDAEREAALELVQTLGTSCRTIICYAGGSDGWPLRSRCEPLIAGARALLDSADPGFA
jgi:hypothetical protein